MGQELKVIQDCYDLTVYLSGRVEKFPRSHRYTLGAEIEKRLLDVLGRLIRAKYAGHPDARAGLLAEANVELEVLRFQVRLAKDLKSLPTTSYGHAAERLDAVGGQVGGWLKASKAKGGGT